MRQKVDVTEKNVINISRLKAIKTTKKDAENVPSVYLRLLIQFPQNNNPPTFHNWCVLHGGGVGLELSLSKSILPPPPLAIVFVFSFIFATLNALVFRERGRNLLNMKQEK